MGSKRPLGRSWKVRTKLAPRIRLTWSEPIWLFSLPISKKRGREARRDRSRGGGKARQAGLSGGGESGAGDAANFADDTYRAAGAQIVPSARRTVGGPTSSSRCAAHADEVGLLREGGTLIGFIWPAQNPELMQQLAAKKATVLAIDCAAAQLSRAQKMDALTSMAGISGYRAVIEAANAFGRFFNGQITAAGKVPPAKVFIAGAGVAGLAAIGTAANLGAIVRANDTRAEVADQVVSLGGEFVKVDYEEEGSGGGGYAKVMSEGFQAGAARDVRQAGARGRHHHHHRADPGQAGAQADHRRDGAEHEARQRDRRHGGRAGRQLRAHRARRGGGAHGVTIVGYTDLVSRLAKQSSTLYSNNLLRLTEELCKTKDGNINVNMEDDAIRGLTVIKDGSITWPPPPPKLPAAPPSPSRASRAAAAAAKKATATAPASRCRRSRWPRCSASARCCSWLVGAVRAGGFLSHFTVFVLACFVGYMVVWNVTPGAAHAADERDQRHLVDHRHRRAGAGGAAAGRRRRPTGPTR
jgi:NAD(P) transhydrogenase subunit alpha